MIYYGLLFFFLLDYVRPSSYVPALNLLHLNSVVPVVIALLTWRKLSANERTFPVDGNRGILLAFVAVLGLSVLTAPVTEYAYNTLKAVLGYVIIFAVIACEAYDLQKIKGIFKVLVLVHLVVAALTPELLTDPEVRHYTGSGGFLGDGNDFALSIDAAIPLCLFLLFDAKRAIDRLVWLLALLLLTACVVASQSRGGTIGLAAVGFYFWLKMERKVRTAAVIATILAFVLLFAPPEYYERMNSISTEEGSAQGRIEAWKAASRMATDSPLLGVGAGHFAIEYGARYKVVAGPNLTAHSIYFLLLGELGLPGLIVLIVFIVYNLLANRAVTTRLDEIRGPDAAVGRQLVASLSASLIAFATAGAFLSAAYYPHWYVLAGLLSAGRYFALHHLNREAQPQPQQERRMHVHWALRPRALAPVSAGRHPAA